MSLSLSELVRGLPVRTVALAGTAAERPADPEVTGVEVDSRRVEPGYLFVAVPGAQVDGRHFARQALEAGASAVVAAPGPVPEGWPAGVPWLEAEDPRVLAGTLAVRAFGHPERELVLAAVTGTNGKSSVATLLAAVLEAAGHPAGVVGTLGYRFGDERIAAERTTPEAPRLVRLLRRWRDRGAEAVALEASSHALALARLDGLAFDVAIFTNLTQDHFDYHRDAESYFLAKRHLFDLLKPGGRPVVHVGDAWGRRLAGELSDAVTYGGEGEVQGQVRAWDTSLSEGGIRGVIETPRACYEFHSPLLGRYNLENVLAVAAAAEALELPHDAVRQGLARQAPLAGRLEAVGRGAPFPIYVDYAHTPGALEAVLASVAELSGRKIILVFGAGGDRDPGKRAEMGRIAGRLADLPILTSDNPRSEDPLAILSMIEEGVREAGNTAYRVVPDRREAIHRAVAVAGPDHVVLVTGKGHEEVQEIGDRTIPFSDREEIEKALEERFGETARG